MWSLTVQSWTFWSAAAHKNNLGSVISLQTPSDYFFFLNFNRIIEKKNFSALLIYFTKGVSCVKWSAQACECFVGWNDSLFIHKFSAQSHWLSTLNLWAFRMVNSGVTGVSSVISDNFPTIFLTTQRLWRPKSTSFSQPPWIFLRCQVHLVSNFRICLFGTWLTHFTNTRINVEKNMSHF